MAVGRLQKVAGLDRTGVVGKGARAALVASMRKDVATYYGPGLYRNRLACGGKLRRGTVGVAHRHLLCGAKVTIRYRGRFLRTRVVDRGPHVKGVKWDLTYGAARWLRLSSTDTVCSAIVR